MKKLIEDLARSNDNELISDPISKAHLKSDFVIVWWYNRATKVLLTQIGREFNHRNLKDFPEIDSDPNWVRGRVLRWEGKMYNCVYDILTYSQLDDLTNQLESRCKISIDFTVDITGKEIVR